jgi:hypothetical protein
MATALNMQIRRRRVQAGELSEEQLKAVNAAVVRKYGSTARSLTLLGVFREVPPEAAHSIRLDDGLRFCQFNLPEGCKPDRLRKGYSLIVVQGESGKTYPLLARL